jgi:hypothetical protein
MVESGEFIKQSKRSKSWFWNSDPAYASAASGILFFGSILTPQKLCALCASLRILRFTKCQILFRQLVNSSVKMVFVV